MPRSQGFSTSLNNRRQSTGLRPVIVLCVISILLLTFYIREGESGPIHGVRSVVTTITSPVRYAGSVVASPFNALGNVFSNLTASQETLSDLKAQNEELTAQVAELSEAQETASRLESLLGLQSTYNLESTAARIIGESSDAWSRTVTIDKGSSDGFAINMPVCNSAGVIGQIIEVSANTSTVRLITDENSGVSAMVQSTRAQGILQGQPDGTLRLEYVTTDADVQEGDIIVTSGIGGVYPKGLPLGTVSTVVREENATYYTITVTPASSDTENNEEVLVITSLTSDQQASDEEVAQANDAPQGTSRPSGSGSSGSSGSTDNSGSSSGGDGDGSGSSSDGK
ncbi:rod shape-determining protein MreC [uncultured Enorma sp.]|uniref:rod shape-determining protein MreC n=1 Tax=uncultured Enorma sp. TaxID=1714346 RepID=UPI0026DDC9EF|nr:rod shape-determining protein MreC [uncultured Enorma sp.]